MVRILAVLVAVTLVVAGAAAFVLYSRVDEPFRGYEGEAQELEIAPGSGTRAIGDKLVAAGIVRDVVTYRVALWLSGDARRLKAGEYRFDRPMNAREVLGQDRPRRGGPGQRYFSRGADDRGDGRHLRGAGPGQCVLVSRRGVRRGTRRATSIVRPWTSKDICSRKPTPSHATSSRSNWSAPWWSGSRTS